jgi:NADP-dependent 3-hydroxy acid dehydrogenase YdfG
MFAQLKNKTVCITGASSGIGEATAWLLAECQARLILLARREDKLAALAEKIRETHKVEVFFATLDVSKQAQVEAVFAELPLEWKHIDILVNNAGLAAGRDPFQSALLSDYEQMIDTNIKGLIYVTRAALPCMLKCQSGHIINIGSLAGRENYPGGSVYSATKHAVRSLSASLKMDLLGTNIRVSSVDPGLVETEFSVVRFKGDKESANKVYQGMKPLTAADIAEIIIFAASRPDHVNVSEVLVMPTAQASSLLVARE